jgi:hypothetical protein
LHSWQTRLSDEEKKSSKNDDEQVRDHGDIPRGLLPLQKKWEYSCTFFIKKLKDDERQDFCKK